MVTAAGTPRRRRSSRPSSSTSWWPPQWRRGTGSAQANALGAFTVVTAVDAGFALATAGLLLVVGSVAGCLVCPLVGLTTDRRIGESMATVALMLGVGCLGLLAMARGNLPLFAVGCVLGFGFGWNGLVHYGGVPPLAPVHRPRQGHLTERHLHRRHGGAPGVRDRPGRLRAVRSVDSGCGGRRGGRRRRDGGLPAGTGATGNHAGGPMTRSRPAWPVKLMVWVAVPMGSRCERRIGTSRGHRPSRGKRTAMPALDSM